MYRIHYLLIQKTISNNRPVKQFTNYFRGKHIIALPLMLCVFFVSLFVLHVCIASAAPSTFAVVSVTNESSNADFNNLLVSQGIAQLVTQELFDTGQYLPVEDKPEIKQQIDKLVALSQSVGADAKPVDQQSVRNSLGVSTLANVRIKKISTSRLRAFGGLFSSATVNLKVDLEVELLEQNKPPLTLTGSGKGTTKSSGVLFEIRNDKIHFDKTSAGIAVTEAVKDCVSKLKNSQASLEIK